MSDPSITPGQCRAARGLLNWTQQALADKARVSKPTVQNFELEKAKPYAGTIVLLRQAFEAAGIEFTNGEAPGVRLRPRTGA